MTEIAIREEKIISLWQDGDIELSNKNYQRAYKFYTEAHDLIIDCPKLHLRAHQHLQRVNRHINKFEFLIDTILIQLAPIKIFELVAYMNDSKVFRTIICKR